METCQWTAGLSAMASRSGVERSRLHNYGGSHLSSRIDLSGGVCSWCSGQENQHEYTYNGHWYKESARSTISRIDRDQGIPIFLTSLSIVLGGCAPCCCSDVVLTENFDIASLKLALCSPLVTGVTADEKKKVVTTPFFFVSHFVFSLSSLRYKCGYTCGDRLGFFCSNSSFQVDVLL